jgi:hypothetical protein
MLGVHDTVPEHPVRSVASSEPTHLPFSSISDASTPANILELPLAQRAEMALKAAVEKVVEEHVRDGRPLYTWRDGKVVEVSAQELREQSTRTQ